MRKVVGGEETYRVHNHHNFAWKEEYNGEHLWVVRKGSTPLHPGQEGFIGSSMAEKSVIVKGVEHICNFTTINSTVHGAGRAYGRKDAIRRFTREQMDDWLAAQQVHLVGGGVDESPMAYKRLHEVLDFHKHTVEITHRLKPWLVLMAGANEKDPFKD